MLIKNIGRLCKQNSKNGEKKKIRILERRYFIDFEKSACEKGIYIWKQVITKSKQTSVYKWQCECEYPSSPDSAMTLMTLTLSSSCFQTDHSWISFELMPGDGTKERNKASHAEHSHLL